MKLLPFDKCEGLRVSAGVDRKGERLEFVYKIEGDIGEVVLPPNAPPGRTDGLWHATCFEAFIGMPDTGYIELNFATSGLWAAYSFTDYRHAMSELVVPPPKITWHDNHLVADIQLEAQSGSPLNLTAIIEHRNGSRSFWALAHPKSNRPDFHTRDCFVAKLP